MSLKKVPVPLLVVMIGLIILALMLALRPKSGATVSAASLYTPSYTSEARVIVNGQPLSKLGAEQIRPLSWSQPREINTAQVYAIVRKKNNVSIIMIDGSEKKLSPPELAQLPAELQLRIRYENPN